MITIIPVYNVFKVRFSNPGSGERAYSAIAKDLSEIHILIDHYQGQPHDESKCPLCQHVNRKKKK